MKLEINLRGNGACPLCSARDDCRIQRLLAAAAKKAEAEAEMEIVIYSCPYFEEAGTS
jgi:hypothetical protein